MGKGRRIRVGSEYVEERVVGVEYEGEWNEVGVDEKWE